MIILYPGIMIVFQLIGRCIDLAKKSVKGFRYEIKLLHFSIAAIPTRHQITCKSYI